MNIIEACDDPHLFGPWFKRRETWRAWFVFLKALFGLEMDRDEFAIYREHTGCDDLPDEPPTESFLVVGRRGGKSFVLALLAVYLACFKEYRQYLQPGERGTVMVIAADRRQARTIIRYIRAMLTRIPMLKAMVEREWSEGFDLTNSTTIEVGTCSFRSTRGYTLIAAICDEIAYWQTDDTSANPDSEVINALRPGLSSIPAAVLICASSPYAKKGELYGAFRKWFGKLGGPLVWRGDTRSMNPTIRQSVIDEALERDRSWAEAEYLAQFRNDIEQFCPLEVAEKCVSVGVYERPKISGLTYRAFVDPAGGSGADSATLAIAHLEKDKAVLDLIREKKPPFSPEDTISEFAAVLKVYSAYEVEGDRWGGEFPREMFRKHGITYKVADLPRSDLYRELLPGLNSGTVDLLDSNILVNQLVGLERRVTRGGKESIDHNPNGCHDDVINAVAGALNRARTKSSCGMAFMPSRIY